MKNEGELRILVASFPRLPGVYLMKDEAEAIIYIGKARDLRARVSTYLSGGDGRAQIQFLMRRVASIERIVTQSEHQALVLERELIGQHKPRYNIRLKDDKSYLCVRIDLNQEWPRIELVRKMEDDGARYFGPFTYGNELRSLLDVIKRVIPLRTCSNTVLYNRTRPCLEYQIKRCAGPCCLPVVRERYREWLQQAIALLEGRAQWLAKDLTKQMEQASDELRFEEAAILRDRVRALGTFREAQTVVTPGSDDRDVFGMHREDRLVTISVLRVKGGRVCETIPFSLRDVEISDGEVLESVVQEFYLSGRDIPEEIVCPVQFEESSLIEPWLEERRKGVSLVFAQRGLKARLLDLAVLNAREHFVATFDAQERSTQIARKLAQKLGLTQIPRRIECVDISNFQGSDTVGALVSFYEGAPDRQAYRKYRLSQDQKPDDFASIYEVVSRRLKRGIEEGDLPDLMIIDGGAGQLTKALQAREEAKVAIEIVALAKMRTERDVRRVEVSHSSERIFVEGRAEPIILDDEDEVTHFVQRIRDEAHRFVITFHRKTRARRVFRSELDDVPGVGPERRSRLMRHFGSVAKIGAASVEEIATIGRMPLSLSEKVKQRLNRQ